MTAAVSRPTVHTLAEAVAAPALLPLSEYVQQVHMADNLARSLYANHPELRPWVRGVTLRERSDRPQIAIEVCDAGGVRVWAASLGLPVADYVSSVASRAYHHTNADGDVAGVPVRVWFCRSENAGGDR